MTPPGLCLLFNNAYSSLSLHADSHALCKHIHKNEINTRVIPHTHAYFITTMRDYFCWFMFATDSLWVCVCVCVCNLTCEVPSCVCSWKGSARLQWSGFYVDLHTIPQNKLITETCEARVNIFYVIWKSQAQTYASQRRWKEARNEEREANEGKIRDLWPSTAVRMKAILSSVFLLSSFLSHWVCVALLLSRLPLFSHGHFSS